MYILLNRRGPCLCNFDNCCLQLRLKTVTKKMIYGFYLTVTLEFHCSTLSSIVLSVDVSLNVDFVTSAGESRPLALRTWALFFVNVNVIRYLRAMCHFWIWCMDGISWWSPSQVLATNFVTCPGESCKRNLFEIVDRQPEWVICAEVRQLDQDVENWLRYQWYSDAETAISCIFMNMHIAWPGGYSPQNVICATVNGMPRKSQHSPLNQHRWVRYLRTSSS